jgi:hypothetical protein
MASNLFVLVESDFSAGESPFLLVNLECLLVKFLFLVNVPFLLVKGTAFFSGSFLSILIGQSRPASLPPELEMGTLQKTSTKKGGKKHGSG